MTGPANGEGERIAYTAKQLFEKIDEKLDRIIDDLEKKASRVELQALEARVMATEHEVIGIQQVRQAYVPMVESIRVQLEEHLRQPHAATARHEDRIDDLERWQAAQLGASGYLWKAVPIAVALAALTISIILKV